MDAAILWDLDGTLVDTAEFHFVAWKNLVEGLGHSFTRGDFAETFGLRNPEIYEHLFPGRFNPHQVTELSERKENYYRDLARQQGVSLLPGASELLASAQAAGWKQGIGSSAPRANIELIMQLTDSARFFGALISGDDTERGKPDPQVFLMGADRLGVSHDRCVVIEDAPSGVQAARAARMKCVAVRFVAHHPAERLAAAGADLIVDSLTAVEIDDLQRLLESVGS